MATQKVMLCPLMQRECIEDGAVIDGKLTACRFWVRVQGKHPQTGETMDHYDCSFCWTPVLMIENTRVNRETGAAVESLRNETINSAHATGNVILQAMMGMRGNNAPALPEAPPTTPLTVIGDSKSSAD